MNRIQRLILISAALGIVGILLLSPRFCFIPSNEGPVEIAGKYCAQYPARPYWPSVAGYMAGVVLVAGLLVVAAKPRNKPASNGQ